MFATGRAKTVHVFSLVRQTEDEGAGGSQAVVVTQNPTAPEVGSAPSREPLQPSLDQEEYWEEGEDMENDRKEKEGIIPLTTDPSPTTGFTETELDPGLEEPMQVGSDSLHTIRKKKSLFSHL